MTYQGADELKIIRTLLPGWTEAVSEIAPASSASAFGSVIGGMFRTAAYDDRLSADENWQVFLDVMYAKVGTLRDLGFTFDAVLASRMCTAEERAFAAMHVVDDQMGKRDIDGYIHREKANMEAGDLASENASLAAAFAMVRHFDIDPERSDVLQECIEALHAALNHDRDEQVDRKLRNLQEIYLRDRSLLREAMWQCITAISPVWIIGDAVRAGTDPEIFADVADVLEPVSRSAWEAVHRLGQSDVESMRWARFLHDITMMLRAPRTAVEQVATVINGADADLLADDRLAIPLQRLVRAGVSTDHVLRTVAAPR